MGGRLAELQADGAVQARLQLFSHRQRALHSQRDHVMEPELWIWIRRKSESGYGFGSGSKPDPGFVCPKTEKNKAEKFVHNFLDQKLLFTYVHATALKRENRELQKMKFINFCLCLWVTFALLNPDPDPRHWMKLTDSSDKSTVDGKK